MVQPARPSPGPTSDQLRRDIDSGATGDKVPVLDPAAAPLGADAEAAGAPPSPRQIHEARRQERARPRLRLPEAGAWMTSSRGNPFWWAYGFVVIGAVIGLLVAAF